MLDNESVDQLKAMITDRFTAEELCEILGLETEDIFEKFLEECLTQDWTDFL